VRRRARLSRRLPGLALLLLAGALLAPVARAADPITPLRDVHRGLHCTALTVVQGTAIASFDVDVIDVIAAAEGEDARILVRVSGPAVAGTGIAEGFSGSPVYCPDANGTIGNAGAISETVGQYGEDVGLVTPIEQMLRLPLSPPSGARSAPRLLRSARPVASPLVLSGLAPSLARLVRHAALARHRSVLTPPAGPLGTFPPQPLVPGASMSVVLSTGAVSTGALGTVTYRDGAKLYGFGHPLDGAGRRSLLLGDGYVFTVVGNPLDIEDATSYKLAAPGHVLGTLSDDALDGVVGSVGATPPTIPVRVTVRDRDLRRTLRQRTDVVDETDVGNPTGTSALAQVAPLAVAQAVTSAFDGAPADETGQLCLHVRLRERNRLLRFCKRYVLSGPSGDAPPLALAMASDVSDALDALDAAGFARLHVTGVTAGVTIARGLRLGTILDAHGPDTVHPGHTARIALLVRIAHGPLRTIRFRLLIPRDAPSGTHALRLAGTPLDGQGDGSGGALAALLGGNGSGEGSDPGPAQSLDEVASAIAAIGGYDGVMAKLGDDRWPAYRSPALRLDGDATLLVRLAPRHARAGRKR
jgi:hypothetical protein